MVIRCTIKIDDKLYSDIDFEAVLDKLDYSK